MKHALVESSHIKSIGHDPDTKTLGVTFHNGSTYHYKGVSETKHAEMLRAKSVGSFFHEHINGKHPHNKVN